MLAGTIFIVMVMALAEVPSWHSFGAQNHGPTIFQAAVHIAWWRQTLQNQSTRHSNQRGFRDRRAALVSVLPDAVYDQDIASIQFAERQFAERLLRIRSVRSQRRLRIIPRPRWQTLSIWITGAGKFVR